MKQLTINFQSDQESTGKTMTLSLPVDSLNHAKASQSQEKEKAKKITVTSGRKCLESFKMFSQSTSWQKMLLDLLVQTGDWYSNKCALTWKMKGTKFNRLYFLLVPKTLRTEEIESGLLPTPRANKVNGIDLNNRKLAERNKGSLEEAIAKQVVNGLLPTPTCSETIQTKEPREIKWNGNSPRVQCQTGTEGQAKIVDLMMNGLLPTPNASDTPAKNTGKRNQDSIPKRIREMGGKTSQLNPQFVGEMMGYPKDWLTLPFLSGEMNQ